MDLNDLTPAPWYEDGYRIYGPTESIDKGSGEVLMEYKHLGGTEADGAFVVLARNAFDVMMRRGWQPQFGHDPDPARRWRVYPTDAPLPQAAPLCSMWFTDPFTALVEADRWYRENVEAKSQD